MFVFNLLICKIKILILKTKIFNHQTRFETRILIYLQVQAELDLISEEAVKTNSGASSSMKDIYGTKLPWPLVQFMMISQQLCGINAGGIFEELF